MSSTITCSNCEKAIDIAHPEGVYYYGDEVFDTRDCREAYVRQSLADYNTCICRNTINQSDHKHVYVDAGTREAYMYCSDDCFYKYACQLCYSQSDDCDARPGACKILRSGRSNFTDKELMTEYTKYWRMARIQFPELNHRSCRAIFLKYFYRDVAYDETIRCYSCGARGAGSNAEGVVVCNNKSCKSALFCPTCDHLVRRRKSHPCGKSVLSMGELSSDPHVYTPVECAGCSPASNGDKIKVVVSQLEAIKKEYDDEKNRLLQQLLPLVGDHVENRRLVTSFVRNNDYKSIDALFTLPHTWEGNQLDSKRIECIITRLEASRDVKDGVVFVKLNDDYRHTLMWDLFSIFEPDDGDRMAIGELVRRHDYKSVRELIANRTAGRRYDS